MAEIIGFKRASNAAHSANDKASEIIDLQTIAAKQGATLAQLRENLQAKSSDTSDFSSFGTPIYFDNSPDALSIIRHSCAHLLAQAIKQLYPDAKFFVGPVVDEGFYYDFKTSSKISEEDLGAIETRMKELVKKGDLIEKTTITRQEAESRFCGDELKIAVMSRIQGDSFGIYEQGDFVDLCLSLIHI